MSSPASVLQSDFMKPAPVPLRALFALAGRLAPSALAQLIAQRMFRPRRRTLHAAALTGGGALRVPYRGAHLNVCVWGTQGPLVLLVHGWEGGIGDMMGFVAPLRAHGCRVAALELPAHGSSPLPDTDLHDMVAALHAFADGHGPLQAMVAHSAGAAAALCFAAARALPPARLALLAPAGELHAEVERLAQTLALPRVCVACLRERLQRRYGQPLELCSVRRQAAAVALPVLVVHDRQDRVVPFAEGQALALQLPQARLIATEGLGHRRLLDDAALLRRVAEFCCGGLLAMPQAA